MSCARILLTQLLSSGLPASKRIFLLARHKYESVQTIDLVALSVVKQFPPVDEEKANTTDTLLTIANQISLVQSKLKYLVKYWIRLSNNET